MVRDACNNTGIRKFAEMSRIFTFVTHPRIMNDNICNKKHIKVRNVFVDMAWNNLMQLDTLISEENITDDETKHCMYLLRRDIIKCLVLCGVIEIVHGQDDYNDPQGISSCHEAKDENPQ